MRLELRVLCVVWSRHAWYTRARDHCMLMTRHRSSDRCGLLQEGDRVLAINGVSLESKALDECVKLLNDSGMRITLLVEYDVAGTADKVRYVAAAEIFVLG